MGKESLMGRLMQARVSSVVAGVLCAVAVGHHWGYCGQYRYAHLPREAVPAQLYLQVHPALAAQGQAPACDYAAVLARRRSLRNWQVPAAFDAFSARGLANGSWAPDACAAGLSAALLVPYRARQPQLDTFLPYMHDFLRTQNIHYKIYLIEQQDDKPWNKAVLLNTGARLAMLEGWPCLILHDVDLLPLDAGNLYGCLHSPRHLSGAVDSLRLVLPYEGLVGGALAVRSDHFRAVGGLSAGYTGWGGEDDDFYNKLRRQGHTVLRLSPEVSHYTMLPHRAAARNPRRHALLAAADHPPQPVATSYTVRPHPMFTLVGVNT